MKLLDDYFKLQKEIHDYFGYVENWVVIPLDDATEYFWYVSEKDKCVRFAVTKKLLFSDGDYYENEIYRQIFLPKWVYRVKDYTMICIDTQGMENKFLRVFDNKKEIIDMEI
jgi:hypothetical protein